MYDLKTELHLSKVAENQAAASSDRMRRSLLITANVGILSLIALSLV